jgi:hypothetical protein
VKMGEKKKVVYVLRRNWDGELYRGLVGKLPMTFESNEEAEKYLRRHNFRSPHAVAVYVPRQLGSRSRRAGTRGQLRAASRSLGSTFH